MKNKFVKLNRDLLTFGIIVHEYVEFTTEIVTIRIIKTDSKTISVNDFMTCYGFEFKMITDKETINELNKIITFQ